MQPAIAAINISSASVIPLIDFVFKSMFNPLV
jgi:hypothetical protein